ATEAGAPANWDEAAYLAKYPDVGKELLTGQSVFGTGPVQYTSGYGHYLKYGKAQGWAPTYKETAKAAGGLLGLARGGLMHRYAEGGTTDSAQDSVSKAQADLQKWLAANNVSHARIAEALGISVAEAKRRYPMTTADTNTGAVKTTSAYNYDVNSPGGGTNAPGAPSTQGDPNSVTNGGFAAAMNALGLTQNPDNVSVVSMGETMSPDAVNAAISQANIDAANTVGDDVSMDAPGQGANSVSAPGGGEAPGDAGNGASGAGTGVSGANASYAYGGISGGLGALARGGQAGYNLGGYSDGGRLLRGPGDGVSDSIPATIGNRQPARLADGEFVIPARIVSELGNGSTEAGARKLYAMMDRVQKARGKTTGKSRVAANTRADKYLPA
ncbi:hypothetical protein K0U83_17160, partial [bacterium]|nr:hypothetical protein [bacterium]